MVPHGRTVGRNLDCNLNFVAFSCDKILVKLRIPYIHVRTSHENRSSKIHTQRKTCDNIQYVQHLNKHVTMHFQRMMMLSCGNYTLSGDACMTFKLVITILVNLRVSIYRRYRYVQTGYFNLSRFTHFFI